MTRWRGSRKPVVTLNRTPVLNELGYYAAYKTLIDPSRSGEHLLDFVQKAPGGGDVLYRERIP